MKLNKSELKDIKASIAVCESSDAIDEMLANATFSSISGGIKVTYANGKFDDFFYTVTLVHSDDIEQ